MYIIYSGTDGRYATACISRRTGAQTHIETLYLGRVLDREAGIYKSRARGIFTFNVETGEFGSVPEDYVPPAETGSRGRRAVCCVDFGDAFFAEEFLRSSGLMEVADQTGYGNPDTLHSMLLFYLLSDPARCDAIHWYEGSFARLLYPRANLSRQGVRSFLTSMGTAEKKMAFQTAWLRYVREHCAPGQNILVDLSGLSRRSRIPPAEGDAPGEPVRLFLVVQGPAGIPLYWHVVPGEVDTLDALSRVLLHLDALGVEVPSCLMEDCASGDRLDPFYDETHRCRVEFILPADPSDRDYLEMIRGELAGLECGANLVQSWNRWLFLKRREIRVGSGRNQPAWLYLGVDAGAESEELRQLIRRAGERPLSPAEARRAAQAEGIFGLLSGTGYPCKEILPAYHQRQSALQTFDFARSDATLLPPGIRTEAAFHGHLLLSFFASCAAKLMQLRLKKSGPPLGARLACLRNQKATVYPDRVVPDAPRKEANRTYLALGIKCPDAIPIQDGAVCSLSHGPGRPGGTKHGSEPSPRP